MKLLQDIVSLVDRDNDPATVHKQALDDGEPTLCLLVCLQVRRHHMWPAVADVVDHLLQLCFVDCRCLQDIQSCTAVGPRCLNSIDVRRHGLTNALIRWRVIKWTFGKCISDDNVFPWYMLDFI